MRQVTIVRRNNKELAWGKATQRPIPATAQILEWEVEGSSEMKSVEFLLIQRRAEMSQLLPGLEMMIQRYVISRPT